MPRYEIERTPEGGASVYIVEPVWAATFASEPEARAYVAWREARDAVGEAEIAETVARCKADEAEAAVHEAAMATIDARARFGALQPPADSYEDDAIDRAVDQLVAPMVAEVASADLAGLFATWAMAQSKTAEIAIEPVPDDEPEPDNLPEDDAAALAALAARADHPARVEITLIPSPADPYHEAGDAFARLKAGEQLGAVADALRLNMPKLRSAWARYQKGLQALAWQPGATVPKPAAPPLEDGWCQCARCRTRFNAAKAQADAKLPQRPTLCAVCRSR